MNSNDHDDKLISQRKSGASPDRIEQDVELNQQMQHLLARIKRLKRDQNLEPMDYLSLRKQYDEEANRDIKQLQKETRQLRINRLMAQADLNPAWLFERMDHQDPVLEYAIQTAHSFISGFEHWESNGGSCVLIYGGYGTGKSTLAGAIAHELIAQHQKSVIFQQWASVIDRLFFGVIEDQEERNRYRRALEEVDLMVIDEIGSNRNKLPESQSSFLGHLLRRRKNLSKSVILITNHTPSALHHAVGDFCFEAIKAFNPVDIHLSGQSRRPHVGNYQG